MNTKKRITVLLADDHTVVREGLHKLLESEDDIEVMGAAASGREAVALAGSLRPCVVVMDIAMPKFNGLEATRQIRAKLPDIHVLILSAHADDAYVEAVMDMGAAGYLIKQASAHCLAEAIRSVASGQTYFSPNIAQRFRRRHAVTPNRNGVPEERRTNLTPREMEVLQQVAEGSANKEIAAELDISIKTVEKHRDNLMRKLDLHDTASLTRYAVETGIIESSNQITTV